jgi:hypothetical protein
MSSLVNNCLQFDGIDDYVEVEIALLPSDMSHELWFKTTVPDGGLFCGVNRERTTSDHRIYLRDGNLYAGFRDAAPISSHGLNLADGQWHHVAHVFGAVINGQRLYVDGRLVAQSSTPGSTWTEQTHLLIGSCPDLPDSGPAWFNGAISDVRVWETIASADQINDYMSIRLWGTEPGLLGYWPFKGGKPEPATDEAPPPQKRGRKSRVTAVDKTRQHHGRIQGPRRVADATFDLAPPPSLTNPALIFDGTDDYLEFPNPFLNTETFTIELWVEPAELAAGAEYGIIGYPEPDGRCKPGLALLGNGGLRYDSYAADGARYTGVLEHFFERAEAWVHLAWVNDGAEYRFYRNGKPFHTVEAGPAQFVAPTETPYWVGRFTQPWKGQLAEVRVWETARTPKQLRQQMKHRLRGNEEGLVACWPLNEGTQVVTDVTDKSHNGRVFGARLSSTTLEFRAPKAAPSGAAIAASTYISQPDGIVELLADDNIFKGLYQRCQEAITVADDTIDLQLDATVLGEFNLFQTLAELRVTSLLLTDVRLEFISEETAIDWGSREAARFMGLRLSGTADLFGLAHAYAVLECVLDDDDFEPAAVLKLRPAGDLRLPVEQLLSVGMQLPAAIERLLEYVGRLQITCPVLAVANESVEGETEFPFSLGIDEGLNIYGALDLADIGHKNPFALIREWLDVEELNLHTTLCKHSTGWQVAQEAMVAKDTPVLAGVGVELVYKGATVGVDIAGHPPEVAILISNTLMLSLNWFDAESLYLTGSMKLEPESFTGAYTLQQSPGSENDWNPFGISGVSVQALAMQLGGTYLAPWIDNVGIATEDVTIGTTRSSLALLVDTNDPDQFVFHLAMNQTTLLELISAFTPVTFAAYQGLPRRWRQMLEHIVDIDFYNVVIHIVPAPTRIGELVFDDEGIMVKGKMSPWGWDAEVDMVVDWDDIDLSIAVEPFSLQIRDFKILSLSGLDDDDYVRMRFARGEETGIEWYLAAEMRLLQTKHALLTQHQASVTVLQLASYFPFLQLGLDVDRRDGTTTMGGHCNLKLNLKKPVQIQAQDEQDVFGLLLKLSFALTKSADELAAELNGDLQFRWGSQQTRLAVAPRLSTTLPNLAPLKRNLRKDRLKQLINPKAALHALRQASGRIREWERASETAEAAETADSRGSQAAQNSAAVHQNGNAPRNGSATRLTQDYRQVAQQVVVTMQGAGEDAVDVGADLLRAMSHVPGSRRARRQKTRLWLESVA